MLIGTQDRVVATGAGERAKQRVCVCPGCGLQQGLGDAQQGQACLRCATVLERTSGRSLDAALACASATFLMLAPANLLPFLTTSAVGVSRHSRLGSGAAAMWKEGWPLLAVAIGLFLVVFPILRFGLLTLVLGALRLGRRPRWLGRAFRVAQRLQPWAMLDVFLLGLWVAYARLSATVPVRLETGGISFIAAGLLTLFTRAVLDERAVWAAIAPDPVADAAVMRGALACEACDLLAPARCEGQDCTRCGARLHRRKPEGVSRATALTLAGLLMYIPANLLPIATIPINLHPTRYTVLEGVKDLAGAGLWGLAALVFCASFAIPLLKLAGMAWCVQSVVRRSRRRLAAKTRFYQVVEEIGRWSMVDPFVIACFIPVTQYNALVYGRAESAAPCFAAVVVTTMLAAQAFDPRRMWDAAGENPGDGR